MTRNSMFFSAKPFTLFIGIVIMGLLRLNAGILTYTNSLTVGGSPNFQLNAIDSVNDGLPTGCKYGSGKGIVTLGIDWDQLTMNSTYPANQTYMVEVIVQVKCWSWNGSVTYNAPETLIVKYNPSVNTTELDRAVFSPSVNCRRMHATINAIKVNGVPKLSTSDVLPKNIYLKVDVIVDRYKVFNTATPCTTAVSGLVNQFKTVTWTAMTGAEEYDVEWTYVDQYATPQAYDFVNNSTRVTLPGTYTSYPIPVIYPSGNIVFRVRGRGRDTSQVYTKITYGTWSVSVDSGSVSSVASAGKFSLTAIEPSKNWQYTATFAELGKLKQVISYFDGTQRNRQMITRNNTDNAAIIGQTIYDQTGRPAIQVLPVPVFEGDGFYNDITYYNDFNQDQGGENYKWDDFDTSHTDCDIITESMKTTSGAALYYSSNNTLRNNTVANIYNYLPDAAGYAFNQVEYMPDNTNRIRRQSGVGINHRLTGKDESNNDHTGKESKYYYATPFQKQLDMLFGNEVGVYKHYKKNAIIDANGQISISYLDPQGRVIATAMAGDTTNTPNLLSLSTASTGTSLTVSLTDQMQVSYQDMSITATSTHFVTTPGTHAFTYTVATPSYKDCLPDGWCFDCVYDLTLSVKDECGLELVPESLATQTVGGIDTICDSITFSITPSPLNLNLSVGTYVINKKLRVNQDALDYYTEMFLENSPCIIPLETFIEEEMSKIDTMECYGGCEECLDRLGDYSEHSDTSKIYDPDYDYLTQEQYDEAVEKCNKLCEIKTPCDILYEQMKTDVTPGGQYALYETDYTVTDDFSLLNISGGHLGSYTDIGTYHNFDGSTSSVTVSSIAYAPANLTVQLFVQNWQNSWAEDLVQFHPEYCYYEYCLIHEDSYIYDMNMMNTGTYAAAVDSGFLDPINTSPFTENHLDPYFFSGMTPNSLHGEMDDSLDHFITSPSLYDLWGFIDYIQDNHMNANCGTNSCWSDYDWVMFRSGYLSEKQKVWKRQIELLGSCPDFGEYGGNAFNDELKLPRYIFDTYGSLQNDNLTYYDINISNSSSPGDIASTAAGFIEGSCDTICNAYAEEWMYQLRRCNGMSDIDSIEIRTRLVDACRGNCSATTPLGGIEFSEVDDILTDVLGPGYATDTCNSMFIVQPVIEGPGAFGMVPMDSCACNNVLNAHIQFDTLNATGNLPAGVCSEQQMFTYLYGSSANIVSFDQLECFCLQQGYYVNDTIVTNSSAGPITTLVAPNCESIMTYYGQTTYTAEMMTMDLINMFNQHWLLDSCIEGTFNVADLGLSLNYLNSACGNCFTTYTTDILASGPSPYAVQFTLHNSCGPDCSFVIGDDDATSQPFAVCRNGISIGYNGNGIVTQDSMQNTSDVWVSPFGNGMYITDLGGTREGGVAKYFFWTDCYNITTEIICSTAFDTTMFVPYNLACEKCLDCEFIFEAVDAIEADYPFVVGMETHEYMHYLTEYVQHTYHQNITYPQLMNFFNNCFTSTEYDTLHLCYEPMFTNYNDPNHECAEFLINTAISNAESRYNDYIDSVSAAFRDAYVKKCLSPVETFNMQYTDKEFHYTLYYYDQAGNLIKTVPPAGVTLITNTNTLDSVQLYRNGISSTRIITKHKLITDYKYTTLNQPAEQRTPDGGLTKYWYDILGRLVLSQNDQQANSGYYSYTKYDPLGRIREVGQVQRNDTAITPAHAADTTYLKNWISAGTKTEITRTIYDASTVGGLPWGTTGQTNLRNRVAYSTYSDTYNANDTIYDNATHYSYDIHGNVKELVQENGIIEPINQHLRKTAYSYDLISGNVLEVFYQPGKKDQFYHKYLYDADNRLLTAKTSRDNIIWDVDARYIYYVHGPLARIELGDNKVQGIDYAYTIQGWIKGINSNTLQAHRDIGGDSKSGSIHAKFARDAAGYSIGYFEGYTIGSVTYPADYKSIRTFGVDTAFIGSTTAIGSNVITNIQKSLFNGNISYMVTTLPNCNTYGGSNAIVAEPLGSVYRYDQLNRLINMTAYVDANYLVMNNKWNSTSDNNGKTYFNRYSYDGNGNLLKLKRKGDQTGSNLCQDSLSYTYATGGAGYYNGQTLNRLSSIAENQTSAARYSNDIDNNSNYSYDDIGNLIGDSGEEINSITWTVYGKVKKVTRTTGSTKSDLEFKYNAAGQRILKIEKPRNASGPLRQTKWIYTFYSHDAQGNIMAIYTHQFTQATSNQYLSRFSVSNYCLYGSSRLGTKEDTLTLSKQKLQVNSWNADSTFNSVSVVTNYTLPAIDTNHVNRETGYKEYELNNHLGNVQATVTDRKVQVSTTPFTTISSWDPDINTLYDYYPFGAPMPGRNLAFRPCSTVVNTTITTVVDEQFASGTGGFSSINSSTLTNSLSTLKIDKTGCSPKSACTGWGATKSFTQINGVQYTVSFTLNMGTCGINTVQCKIKDPSTGTITTQSYTTGGSKSFTFTGTANGTGSIEFIMSGSAGCFFTVDNVLITYEQKTVSTACASGSDSYIFGFNGKEKLNEQYGEGNGYDFGARIYDPRIGRFLSFDPLGSKYPYSTPYSFVLNNPLWAIDPEGEDVIVIVDWPSTQGSSGHMVIAVTTYESVTIQVGEKTEIYWYATGVAYYQASDGGPHAFKGNWIPFTGDYTSESEFLEAGDYTAAYTITDPKGKLGGEINDQLKKDVVYYTSDEVAKDQNFKKVADEQTKSSGPYAEGVDDCSTNPRDVLLKSGLIDEKKHPNFGTTKLKDGTRFAAPNDIGLDLKALGFPEKVYNKNDYSKMTRANSNSYAQMEYDAAKDK